MWWQRHHPPAVVPSTITTRRASSSMKRSRLLIGLFLWFSSVSTYSVLRTLAVQGFQHQQKIHRRGCSGIITQHPLHPVFSRRRDHPRCRLADGENKATATTAAAHRRWIRTSSDDAGSDDHLQDPAEFQSMHVNLRAADNIASYKSDNESSSVSQAQPQLTRRRALQQAVGLTIAAAATQSSMLPASAGVPEIDSWTGNLFTPKSEMLSGGSAAARGIPFSRSMSSSAKPVPGQVLQSIYETRFVAYLSRFLLNFDPSARAYWVQQGFGYSWDDDNLFAPSVTASDTTSRMENAFAEFAESVEVGLADYFSGPFGSYSSLPAAMAGITASNPAPSKKTELPTTRRTHGFLDDIFSLGGRLRRTDDKKTDSIGNARQGILNLYTLLKARYTSASAKRQLAILFSFVSSPSLQPVNEIRSLLGEADNATVTGLQIFVSDNPKPLDYRTSSRRGGGYSLNDIPSVTVEDPPPLGDQYKPAEALPLLKPTSRVLKITLLDGGEGYVNGAPAVTVQPQRVSSLTPRTCQATAILDRQNRVASIFVLDPGYGYGGGGGGNTPPTVRIEPPPRPSKSAKGQPWRRARAVAELEYKMEGLQLLKGGNGFVCTEPPRVKITPPREDPDWYLDVRELPSRRVEPLVGGGGEEPQEPYFRAEVTEMQFPGGNIAYSKESGPNRSRAAKIINDDLLDRLSRDPLEMLPSSARPELVRDTGTGKVVYSLPQLAAIPQFVAVLSPRYRACDPIFGGIGRLPVTKGATELEPSEYARLALSGAVCTVVVRTLLNPLELIKTKQQLQNDDELMAYARSKLARAAARQSPDDVPVPADGGGGAQMIEEDESSGDQSSSLRSPSSPSALATNGTVVAIPTKAAVKTDTVTASAVSTATTGKPASVGTADMLRAVVELRGPLALFQSADITFLASLVFGSFGFGATELFRRSFSAAFLNPQGGGGSSDVGSELVLLLAAGMATVLTAAAASPFEVLRVRSMGLLEPQKWTDVLQDFLADKASEADDKSQRPSSTTAADTDDDEDAAEFDLWSLKPRDLLPLWSGFAPILSRELPFAIAKFLTFDLIASAVVALLNSQSSEGALPVQIGVGTAGLAISAGAGAVAGIAGAFVSHPADLILTKTSASRRRESTPSAAGASSSLSTDDDDEDEEEGKEKGPAWVQVVQDLVSQDGGLANLFVGLGSRSLFFFLVIGLQFFLYDYVRNLFQVGSDDLSLVLDVFYAVRVGLVEMAGQTVAAP